MNQARPFKLWSVSGGLLVLQIVIGILTFTYGWLSVILPVVTTIQIVWLFLKSPKDEKQKAFVAYMILFSLILTATINGSVEKINVIHKWLTFGIAGLFSTLFASFLGGIIFYWFEYRRNKLEKLKK